MGQTLRKARWRVLWSLNSIVLLGLCAVVGVLYLGPLIDEPGAAASAGAIWTIAVLGGLVVVFCLMLLRQGQRLSSVRDELAEAKLEEQRVRSHLLEISSLFDAAHQAQMHLELKPVLSAVSQRLLACLDVDAVSIFLTSADGQSLSCVAAAGMDVAFVRGAEVKMGEGIAGHVARTSTPVVIGPDDLQERFPESTKPRRAIFAGLCVPLTVRDEVIGVLNATRIERQREFAGAELRLVGVFAGHLGITIQRIRDLELLGARTRALEKAHRAKDSFLSALNHELRTPLATIAAYAEVLQDGGAIELEERNNYGRTILTQSHRLRESLEELQDLYALEGSALSLATRPARLNAIVEQVLDQAAGRERRMHVLLEHDCDEVTIEADVDSMESGLRILLAQVTKHLGADASLRVATRLHRACLDGPQAVVVIESCGARLGLDAVASDVAAPAEGRTPLTDGLRWTMHLVIQLVEAHGGRAWSEDTADGARISLAFPARAVAVPALASPEPDAALAGRTASFTITRYR